ncbi:hypothetical protein SAMN05660649_03976 [Desulfotomaculum arcticum]|uniref:Uncharacterized protein n=1 Tax=Desulfotruncus arcticus DSM 17038 TaxID=1121424 RepID=A0A1I2XHY5_9FIRM|nr:hypothetical protein [Desulfotruncus arcticus]SFH12677.1 hypothetical protein SAMN05660649_03976 [Desulfotomaculum arcticum] [Desulfotruncus arcticus DSM 17038]
MNTLIILLIIFYLVFSRLARTANRTPIPPRPKETDFPLPADTPNYSEEDDAPLSGPWNRNGGAVSGRRQEETPADDPVLMEPEPQRTGDIRHLPEPATRRQPVEQPVPLEVVRRQPEPGESVCPQGKSSPGQGQEHRKRRRGKNPLAAALNGKSELAGSILVGEIIGTRGGYRGRRK